MICGTKSSASFQLAGDMLRMHIQGEVQSPARALFVSKTKSSSQAELRAAQLRYVEHVLKTDPKKRSKSQLARAAGLHHTTLTRFLDHRSSGTLETLTIRRIAEVSGIPPGAELEATSIGETFEETEPYLPGAVNGLRKAVESLLEGRNASDPVTVRSRSLELAGIMPGDVVIVDHNAMPKVGDAVMAQVYDWQTALARTILRLYKPAGPVSLLESRTMDPALQETLVVDGERVTIRGVVTDVVRRRAA